MSTHDENYAEPTPPNTLDLPLYFMLVRSVVHGGYDFIVTHNKDFADGPVINHAAAVIASNIPNVRAALAAIVDAFTAPLIDRDRLDILEEATGAISGLLDRVTELESQVVAMRAQAVETNNALIRLMAGGQVVTSPPRMGGLPMGVGVTMTHVPESGPEPPRFTEPGFAGTFRRPLAESVHRPTGGAYRPGNVPAPRPSIMPESHEEEGEG